MFLVLVAHDTVGLKTDVAMVGQTIKNHFADKIEIGSLIVPVQLTRESAAFNEHAISLTRSVDVVIFFEHTVDHPRLWDARHRILIPNPEWLSASDLVSRLTEMWHKTHVSLATLGRHFPSLRHSYIGFTSPDLPGPPNFERFIHFKGASLQKQTQVVLAAWRKHPEWPELNVQSYVNHPAFLNFPEWLQWQNIRIRYCRVSDEEHRSEVTRGGVHLCPSSIEGFGHYINEARSIGALVVTTNAAPMNELIDETCGLLISPVRTEQQNFAALNIIDVPSFEIAIETVLAMPSAKRKELGANARRRYLRDRERFHTELIDQLRRLIRS